MPGVTDRVALVTGASRGIGRVAAELLSTNGAKVMCVARGKPDDLELPFVSADLGTAEGCDEAVEAAEDQLGPVDILVCNHGIGSAHEKAVWQQDDKLWAETMRINLDGPYFLSKRVMQGMVERGYGRLVYTSSTAGLVAEPEACAYNASKHGLIGLMRSAALDGGRYNITSNAVLPGWVRTEMAEKSAEQEAIDRGISKGDVWAEREALYPAGRVVTPEEVAETILFLSSEESGGVSGEAIRVALGTVV